MIQSVTELIAELQKLADVDGTSAVLMKTAGGIFPVEKVARNAYQVVVIHPAKYQQKSQAEPKTVELQEVFALLRQASDAVIAAGMKLETVIKTLDIKSEELHG